LSGKGVRNALYSRAGVAGGGGGGGVERGTEEDEERNVIRAVVFLEWPAACLACVFIPLLSLSLSLLASCHAGCFLVWNAAAGGDSLGGLAIVVVQARPRRMNRKTLSALQWKRRQKRITSGDTRSFCPGREEKTVTSFPFSDFLRNLSSPDYLDDEVEEKKAKSLRVYSHAKCVEGRRGFWRRQQKLA